MQGMDILQPFKDTNPMCRTCAYVMPSESASTGWRCGRQYFLATSILRKFQRMDNYPVVKEHNACEAWLHHQNAPTLE
ncbi:hypothetical protein B9Z35_04335 [Limnohabitans sp. Jir61]|nr:hypothetical protein B9Z35_04335 [Limnohabitans sp. Jir61]